VDPSFIIYVAPAAALVALIYAYIRAGWVRQQDPGNDRMQMIGKWIADGAMAFLAKEYRTLAVFVIAIALLLGFTNAQFGESQNTNWLIAVSFVLGAVCSAPWLASLECEPPRQQISAPLRQPAADSMPHFKLPLWVARSWAFRLSAWHCSA